MQICAELDGQTLTKEIELTRRFPYKETDLLETEKQNRRRVSASYFAAKVRLESNFLKMIDEKLYHLLSSQNSTLHIQITFRKNGYELHKKLLH